LAPLLGTLNYCIKKLSQKRIQLLTRQIMQKVDFASHFRQKILWAS